MKVAFTTTYVSRNAGGLYSCVRDLACAVKNANVRVDVLAYWDDATEHDKESWEYLNPHILKCHYLAGIHFGNKIRKALHAISPDLVHANGIWLRTSAHNNAWARQTGRPYLISLHGMLDPWALRNSRWKKKIAGYWYEHRHLREAACLHALCEEEAIAFRDYGLKNPICILPNGVILPSNEPTSLTSPPWEAETRFKGRKPLLYIGRIHPKKGLPLLIDAWASIRSRQRNLTNGWFLAIAGFEQVGHLEEIKQQARECGISEDIIFTGSLMGNIKDAAFRHAGAFVLPSYSEGLPLTILEAWSYGLPVLMTSGCNLSIGFDEFAALRIEANVESVTEGLLNLFSMNSEERKRMGQNGHALVCKRFRWDSISHDMIKVYHWIRGDCEAPECVLSHGI